MKAVYIIETEAEREKVKELFRKRVADIRHGGDRYNYLSDLIGFYEDDDLNEAFYRSAEDLGTIYDMNAPGIDGIVVYDFTAGEVHLKDDTASLFNLPSRLFPF